MGKCDFKLANGEKCGLETEGGNIFCPLHKTKTVTNESINNLKKYIDSNKRDYIDLSSISFSGITFNQDLFNKKLLIKFNESTFLS